MQREPIFSADGPKGSGPYSPAMRWGDTVYVSGQVAIDPATNQVIPGSLEDEAHRTFKNLEAQLKAAGSGLERCVKVTVYLADIGDFAKLNEIYLEFFSDPYPARTTVQATLVKGLKIEVDAIAVL